jgi:cytochrome c oxidase subunit 3
MIGTLEKRRSMDVSQLPSTLFDTSALIWWGNTLLLTIETAMFGILIALYFSVMMNTSPFPPPRVDRLPVIYHSEPEMTLPIAGLILLIVSLAPAIFLDYSARKRRPVAVKLGLVLTILFNIAAIVLRYYEFDSLHFKWNDNAYGSITWMILGIHMFHLIAMFCEDTLLIAWTFANGLDDKHALDLTVMAVYWYWIVGIWLVLFTLVYGVPYMIQ